MNTLSSKLKRGWQKWRAIAKKAAIFQTTVLLSILYFLSISIIWTFSKLMRKDFLSQENKESFWIKKKKIEKDIDSFYRQS